MENIVKLWTPTIGELVCKKFTKKMFVVGAYGISGFTEHHLLRGEIQPFLGKSPTFYV